MTEKCEYSGDEHTPVYNPEGGFIYCAECSDILKITDEAKANVWFKNNRKNIMVRLV